MEQILSLVHIYLDKINAFIWGAPMLGLLLGIGIYLTVKLRFIQKYTWQAIKLSVVKDDSEGMVSNLGSFAVAMAATVGTGNIIGVGTAIVSGGPGALFWMLFAGFFGIATKYGECLLAVKYRVRNKDGEIVGGPMYYISKGLKMKRLAVLFCVGTLIMGGADTLLQSNSIGETLMQTYHLPHWVCALFIGGFTGIVIIGGVKKIAKVSELLIPVMVVFYLISCSYIIFSHISQIPSVIALVFKSAFNFNAVAGGAVGITIKEAIRFGIARGIFSNEAGQGSAPIVAAAAKTRNPVRQGLIASSAVFWDTIIICTTTGLTVLLAGDWQSGTKYGAAVISDVFKQIPYIGPFALAFSLSIFAFTTLVAWYYYTEKAWEFLAGNKYNTYLKAAWVGGSFLGSFTTAKFIWTLGDFSVAMMAIPNIIALILLRKSIVSSTKRFLKAELETANNM
jgi:AGCS family alanine or glycine:cation symporter